MTTLHKNWDKSYSYTKKKDATINRIWKCLPSILCWQIWLARNKCIFKEQKPSLGKILSKTWSQVSEIISTNGISKMDKNNLQQEEKDWYTKATLENKIETKTKNKEFSTNKRWKLRLDDK